MKKVIIPKEERHTSLAHAKHRNVPCGCSVDRETDVVVCKCGAAYTSEALEFPQFWCYDCRYTIRHRKIEEEAEV